MKPDCRRVLSQIASYSVEELSADDASAFTRHLDDCPPCQGQWLLFEKTMTTLSHTSEANIEVERSRQMWLTCVKYACAKSKTLPTPWDIAAMDAENEVMSQPSSSASREVEGDRRPQLSRRQLSPRNADPGWLEGLSSAFRPQFGYALASGAAVVLGAAYLWSPVPEIEGAPVASSLPAMPLEQPRVVAFQAPPPATAGMLDYHSAMAFEPFSDHVAPTLVSYTATQP